MHNVLWGYAADPQFERKEAVRLSRFALSIDDGDPDTLATTANISAFMVGDSESEIEMADRAVALNPNSYLAWSCRGWVYEIAGLPEEAVRSFERAIRMSPIDPRLHGHRACNESKATLRRTRLLYPQDRRRIMRTRPSRAPLLGASGKTHCVCFEVQTGKRLLDLNFTAFVPGCVQRRHSSILGHSATPSASSAIANGGRPLEVGLRLL
jgi:tetratricopeptide (TPR) repeat protein